MGLVEGGGREEDLEKFLLSSRCSVLVHNLEAKGYKNDNKGVKKEILISFMKEEEGTG